MPFAPSGNHLGANLSFTKFLFILPRADDDAVGTRLKGIGGLISRGFFNDFDANGTRDGQPHETIQFLVSDGDRLDDVSPPNGLRRLTAARYALQVSGKYRPRLQRPTPKENAPEDCFGDWELEVGSCRLRFRPRFGPVVHHLAIEDRHVNFRVEDLFWPRGEDICREDDHVREHASFQRALALFVE
jgi:hypothetical protein